MSDDFYEDDEPVEKILDAFVRGERGATGGQRDLDPPARAIVERAVLRIDDLRFSPVRLQVVESRALVQVANVDCWVAEPLVEVNEGGSPSQVEYLVG
jgi:hypothetical protein